MNNNFLSQQIFRFLQQFPYYLFLLLFPVPLFAGFVGSIDTDPGGNGFELDLSCNSADPVSMSDGSYYENWPLLSLGGPMQLEFQLNYQGSFYSNYRHSGFSLFPTLRYNSNLIIRLEDFELKPRSGQRYLNINFGHKRVVLVYDRNSQQFIATGPTPYQLKIKNNYYYLLDPIQEKVYMFRSNLTDLDWYEEYYFYTMGQIETIMDRNHNQLNFSYNSYNQPTSVSDGLGRELNLEYETISDSNPISILKSVSDSQRQIQFNNLRVNNGRFDSSILKSFTDAMGNTTTFSYNDENKGYLITSITQPKGNQIMQQSWERVNEKKLAYVVKSQTDAYGNQYQFDYQSNSDGDLTQVLVNLPNGSQQSYQHDNYRYPTNNKDASGNAKTSQYNSTYQLTQLTDRNGNSSKLSYHPQSGKPTSKTDANGVITTYQYSPQSQSFTNPVNGDSISFTFYNLSRIQLADRSFESYSYDAKGNINEYTDSLGQLWKLTYNSQGLILSINNPVGGVSTYTYNTDATIATSSDSNIGTSIFSYDSLKRLTKISSPLNGESLIAYNANNQIISYTDGNNQNNSYLYDTNGNLQLETDAAGNSTKYEYDDLNRLIRITDRNQEHINYSYNSLNQVAAETNANQIQTNYSYDSRGWLSSRRLNHKSYQFSYNNEGIRTATTSPLGLKTKRIRDTLGQSIAIIQPNGEKTQFQRNALGQISKKIDPMNYHIKYQFNPKNRPTQIQMADSSTVNYIYNELGKLQQFTDLNEQTWRFSHSTTGQLTTVSDPYAGLQTFSYDQEGRIETVTYPDETAEKVSYDKADNIIHREFSDNHAINYSYDVLNQLISSNNIQLTRDNESRITSSQFNNQKMTTKYDAGGRIRAIDYAGQVQINYSYNADNLLSAVTDNLGNQVQFTYDDDARLIKIQRSNGITSTWQWDNNSRLVSLADKNTHSIVNIQLERNPLGQITHLDYQAPSEPILKHNSVTQQWQYNQASQITNTDTVYDKRGRVIQLGQTLLAWDAANRLVSINGDQLSYNGLGDLVKKTDTTGSRYFHHLHSMQNHPIVAEQNNNGQFSHFYIYASNGRLLYSLEPTANNQVRFYHSDHLGSTIALSNAAGVISDSYSYTPSGKISQHNGNSEQPFTYLGTLGVRQESSFYQMQHRYYDPDSGRFLSKEPIWPQTMKPQNLNPYQYAYNNPLLYSDINGLEPEVAMPIIEDEDRTGETPLQRSLRLNREFHQEMAINAKLWKESQQAQLEHQKQVEKQKTALKKLLFKRLLLKLTGKLSLPWFGSGDGKQETTIQTKNGNVVIIEHSGLYSWDIQYATFKKRCPNDA